MDVVPGITEATSTSIGDVNNNNNINNDNELSDKHNNSTSNISTPPRPSKKSASSNIKNTPPKINQLKKKQRGSMAGLKKSKKKKSLHSRHARSGKQKNSSFNHEQYRLQQMNNPSATFQQIISHAAPPKQLKSPLKAELKKKLANTQQELDKKIVENKSLQKKYARLLQRVSTLKNDNREKATIINEQRKASNAMIHNVQKEAEAAEKEILAQLKKVKTKQKEAVNAILKEQKKREVEVRKERTVASDDKKKIKAHSDKLLKRQEADEIAKLEAAELRLNKIKSQHDKNLTKAHNELTQEMIMWTTLINESEEKADNASEQVVEEKRKHRNLMQEQLDKTLKMEKELRTKISELEGYVFELSAEVKEAKREKRAAEVKRDNWKGKATRRLVEKKELQTQVTELNIAVDNKQEHIDEQDKLLA